MARRPRPDSVGAWFHVMNRGAAKQRIFYTKHDARQFLALAGEASERFGVEVHTYCLMTNHYHLLVRCPTGGLSEFMQWIGSHYVRYLNARLGQDGPLFRGRFHAVPLPTSGHVQHVSRYIHRNPLDIRPPVALDRYDWSSYRYYSHDQAHPSWLRMNDILAEHGSRSSYRTYVEGNDRGGGNPPWEWAVSTAVDELVEDASTRTNIGRTVAVGLLDSVDHDDRTGVEVWLAFPSRRARTQAVKRMRERRATNPIVAEIVTRALELAA